jgi:6-phosphogluconate dehydrogenase
MGANLARNFASHGIGTSVFNRTFARTESFLKEFGSEQLQGFEQLEDFISSLEKPRRIFLMVQAGAAVDEVLGKIYGLLDPGDYIIDCGNSYYEDTERRQIQAAAQKLNFIGMGISGGEEGALKGPSLMPGMTAPDWQHFEKVLETIAARDFQGGACVTPVGAGGAGHFVKMVHNGIEYAILQLIAEIYDYNRKVAGLGADAIAGIFTKAAGGKAASFLTEIAAAVLRHKDGGTEKPLVDLILDRASQKGTGGWTAIESFKFGAPAEMIGEAVSARTISSLKELRLGLSKNPFLASGNLDRTVSGAEPDWEKVLLAGMIVAFTQGFQLIKLASEQKDWQVNPAELARIWQGGCIIRAGILSQLQQAWLKTPSMSVLLEDTAMQQILKSAFPELQKFVVKSASAGLAVPASASAFNYLLAISDPNAPANLIQGLRDLFGAHTFERTDQKGIFHEDWQN